MNTRFVAAFIFSALSLVGANGSASADPIGLYECNIVGAFSQEPLGDRSGHGLMSYQYSCFGVGGLLKGATYTANLNQEWDGPKGTFLLAGGVHRVPGGLAVTEPLEGTASVVMKDGTRRYHFLGKSRLQACFWSLGATVGENHQIHHLPYGFQSLQSRTGRMMPQALGLSMKKIPDLAISAGKIAAIISKARQFDVKDVVTDPDSGSNASDDAMLSVLEDQATTRCEAS
jgi:hypothetical protein